jgi:hypothetical protein
VSFDDCHRKFRVNGEFAEPVTVKVSVSPAVKVSKFGPVKIGFDAVIQRMMTIPDPPLPPIASAFGDQPEPPPPAPVFAVAGLGVVEFEVPAPPFGELPFPEHVPLLPALAVYSTALAPPPPPVEKHVVVPAIGSSSPSPPLPPR